LEGYSERAKIEHGIEVQALPDDPVILVDFPAQATWMANGWAPG
jgi:hypothetical protein